MKIDNDISTYVSKANKIAESSERFNYNNASQLIKKSRGDSVQISLEAIQRAEFENSTDNNILGINDYYSNIINDESKSTLTIEKDNDRVFYRLTDKETNEIIKEIPSEHARNSYDRIDKFIEGLSIDLYKID